MPTSKTFLDSSMKTIILLFLLPLGVAGQGGFFQVRFDVPAPLRQVNTPEQDVNWYDVTTTRWGWGLTGEWVQPLKPRFDAVFSAGYGQQLLYQRNYAADEFWLPLFDPARITRLGTFRHVQLEAGALWKLFGAEQMTLGLEASVGVQFRWLDYQTPLVNQFSYQKTTYPLSIGFRGINKYVTSRLSYQFVPGEVLTRRSLSIENPILPLPADPPSTWVDTRLFQQRLVVSAVLHVSNCYKLGKDTWRDWFGR